MLQATSKLAEIVKSIKLEHLRELRGAGGKGIHGRSRG
jgi:hypothetical protein